MSEAREEMSMLEQFKVDLMQYRNQLVVAQTNIAQLQGAIFACEQMIAKMEVVEGKGAKLDEQANIESPEQPA